ncbi:MAG: hypothetical protein ABI867_23770 [Kofleriaceae bacterium]
MTRAESAQRRSQKLDPAVTTAINLGDCRERSGQLATAWGVFVEAARQVRDATDEKSRLLLQVAESRAAKLEPRLSKLTVDVPASHRVAGLEVRRDTIGTRVLIDAGAWGRALPLDAGTYTIVARAPGRDDWSTSVTIGAEADAKIIAVPMLATTRVVAPKVAPAPSHPRSRARLFGLGLVSVGGATTIAGLALGWTAISRWHQARDLCGVNLECDNDPDLRRAHTLATAAHARGNLATIVIGGGLALAAGGVAALWVGRSRERIAVVPQLNPTSIGVALDARF